jgi:hypothetical protein
MPFLYTGGLSISYILRTDIRKIRILAKASIHGFFVRPINETAMNKY